VDLPGFVVVVGVVEGVVEGFVEYFNIF